MVESAALFIGIDVGTSGVRAVAIDAAKQHLASAGVTFDNTPYERRDARGWWAATEQALANLLREIESEAVAAIAVDGTSGTVLPVDVKGAPLAEARLYNDRCNDSDILMRISEVAPDTAAVHGASSALARVIGFSEVPGAAFVLHEADWVASRLSGLVGLTDENNSLKSGYDPQARAWPDWISETGADTTLLPEVREPGTIYGPITTAVAVQFGLSDRTMVVAGSTDGCASFLATGADQVGDGVSALGSTLTLKLLSDRQIVAPTYGIYSHRIGDLWLSGGASNTGGAVLLHYFSTDELADLSAAIDPERPIDLNYYPLVEAGERFPINDPNMAPRFSPRPDDDVQFLQAMLEGMAEIEALGYTRIEELGGPALSSLRTVGGGATNSAWTRIRQKRLDVNFAPSLSKEAATGAALLARKGAMGCA